MYIVTTCSQTSRPTFVDFCQWNQWIHRPVSQIPQYPMQHSTTECADVCTVLLLSGALWDIWRIVWFVRRISRIPMKTSCHGSGMRGFSLKNVLQSFNGFLLLAGIRIQTRSQMAIENKMPCRPRDVIVIPALLMCVPVSVCEYYLNSRLHYIHGYYISQKHKSMMTKFIIPIWCIYGKRSCGKYSLFLKKI